MDLQPFLTAYDPSDLPGGSVDPLGFDRGYTTLADKILPGLTNVANRPRYFSIFCTALLLTETPTKTGGSQVERVRSRLDAALRLERMWTLACALATRRDEALDPSGIRGIRYVEAEVNRIGNQSTTRADFRLLSRQQQYGLVGIYGSVGEGLKLFVRPGLELHDVGRRLAEAFIAETKMPSRLRDAVAGGGAVPVDDLAEWGARAHVGGAFGINEARVFIELVERDDTRRRMVGLLQRTPAQPDEHELGRLRRIAAKLEGAVEDSDLLETLAAIELYEDVYRSTLVVFQRILGRCQQEEPYELDLARVDGDEAIQRIVVRMKRLADRATIVFGGAKTAAFQLNMERLSDAKEWLGTAATLTKPRDLAIHVMERHRRVQSAKNNDGRPKMPWLEVADGRIKQTLSLAQQIGGLPEEPEDILAHPYRTLAADRFFGPGAAAS